MSADLASPDISQLDEVELVSAGHADPFEPVLDEVTQANANPFPSLRRQPLRFVGRVITTAFGIVSLIFLLAVLAAIPLVNFFVLGYLLEVEGRIGRTGQFRHAFPLLNDAPRIGSIVLGFWLFLLPLRLFSGFVTDAQIIDPASRVTVVSSVVLQVAWLVITVHLILALARGGSLGCFLRPIKNIRWLVQRSYAGDYFATAGKHVGEFIRRLRLRHHFSLGLRGFGVGMLWLFLPTAFYAAVRKPEGGQILLMLLGGAMLVVVLSWVPFLQAHFVTENRFRSGLQLREVRQLYRYAPLCWLLATIVVYLLALPLYLFKAFLLPPDAMWPITLIFVLSIYPTRIITGWAYHVATVRRQQGKLAHWSLRWAGTLLLVPLLGIFVFILYFTQFLGEQGKLVLFHHHALLLPAPFGWSLTP